MTRLLLLAPFAAVGLVYAFAQGWTEHRPVEAVVAGGLWLAGFLWFALSDFPPPASGISQAQPHRLVDAGTVKGEVS